MTGLKLISHTEEIISKVGEESEIFEEVNLEAGERIVGVSYRTNENQGQADIKFMI